MMFSKLIGSGCMGTAAVKALTHSFKGNGIICELIGFKFSSYNQFSVKCFVVFSLEIVNHFYVLLIV